MRTLPQLGRAPTPPSNRQLGIAVGLDVFSVVLFVAIGRRNHDESGGFTAVLETAAPLLIGLGVAWLVVRAWRRPTKVSTGLFIWPIAVLTGMIVRNLAFGDGTATSFVIVTTVFLGACFVGWRAIYRSITTRRGAAIR